MAIQRLKSYSYYVAHEKAERVKKILQVYIESSSFGERLDRLENLSKEDKSLMRLITDDEEIFRDILSDVERSKNTALLLSRVEEVKKKKYRRRRIRVISWSVAASVLIGSVVMNLYQNGWLSDNTKEISVAGFQRPTLILENGNAVALEGSVLNVRNEEQQLEIQKQENLSWHPVQDSLETFDVKYNKIIVPAGYTYDVELTDGTRVKLNAQSSLEYPVSFKGLQIREVNLSGEAYFQVAKGKIPFVVSSKEGNVTVHGTTFNVYNGTKGLLEVLLVEGSVGVRTVGGDSVSLKPSQLAICSSVYDSIQVKDVDVDNYLGWITGDFVFKDQYFKRVCQDISSWYGITIHIPEELAWEKVTLVMAHHTELSIMLNFISNIFGLEPRIKGKEVWLLRE